MEDSVTQVFPYLCVWSNAADFEHKQISDTTIKVEKSIKTCK